MDILERLKTFTVTDFICSYSAKFLLGMGLGLLLADAIGSFGWLFILLAVLVGARAEVKFFRTGK